MKKRWMTSGHNTSGQIGIIIVLIMVVLLTIGLSLAQQSSREVTLSQQEYESTRTLNAAEGGIEAALSTNLSAQTQQSQNYSTTVPGSNSNINYTVAKIAALETRVLQGGTAMVQLTNSAGVQTASQINIEWAKEASCAQKPAGLVIAVYSYDATKTPKSSAHFYAYAACDYGDNLPVISGSGTNGYTRKVTLLLQPKDTIVRIKPVYNDTELRVTAAVGALPTQEYAITSSAANQQGSETRTVQVNRTLSIAPSIMDYALFSGNTLVK